jgi:uncharacterized repeat protein (TIGR01451 family)
MKQARAGLVACALLVVTVLAAAPAAFAADTMKLTNEVFQEIDATGPNGEPIKKIVPAAKVVPGTEVIYVITYKNHGTEPAEDVVISNPIAAELAYKNDTANGEGAMVELSADKGETWGRLADLLVRERGKIRPAQAGDVTNIRWTIEGAVPPGGEGQVSFRAVLR